MDLKIEQVEAYFCLSVKLPSGGPRANSRHVPLRNLVCIDKKSCKQTVSPEWVEEQAILLGVEDLKPNLVSFLEPEHSRA